MYLFKELKSYTNRTALLIVSILIMEFVLIIHYLFGKQTLGALVYNTFCILFIPNIAILYNFRKFRRKTNLFIF